MIPPIAFTILKIAGRILRAWWWVFPPLVLLPLAMYFWLWWRQVLWEGKQKYVFLELIPPPEVLKPFRSMEAVLNSIWGIYSSLNLKKKWWLGRKLYYLCFEIVSFGAYTHMFIRCRQDHQDTIEAALYAQYPGMEINTVKDDYINQVPFGIPNKHWNLYGLDEMVIKSELYPILTYSQFFEERPDVTKEEKRIDPLGTLLEGMAKVKKDEQIWIQIKAVPVTPRHRNYAKRGEALVNKLVFRAKKKRTFAQEFLGAKKEEKKEESFIPPEMKLTPKERENVKLIEDKMGKRCFETNIRVVYFGKSDIFQRGRRSLAEQFFNNFSTADLNAMKKWKKTKTRCYYFWVKRRVYKRQRNILRRYYLRESPLYPRKGGTYVLSTEELATIFHLPANIRELGTFLPRIESRAGEAPSNLPFADETADNQIEKTALSPKAPFQRSKPMVQSKKGESPSNLPFSG